MKLMVLAFLAFLSMPQATSPQSTAKDREASVAYLEQTRDRFLKSIDGLSDAQWTFKAAPDRWSVAEVAEHIAVSESTLLQLIAEKVMKAPKPATAPRTLGDQQIIDGITDRTQKAQAPEMLRPANRWATRDALTKDFLAARQKTIDFAKTTDDLRGHFADFPAFKADLDGHQWVLFLAGHSARHTAQIDEVKASAGYPAR
ncbi:MAG: DinB family protein [Vicinamibacterales bacterium]